MRITKQMSIKQMNVDKQKLLPYIPFMEIFFAFSAQLSKYFCRVSICLISISLKVSSSANFSFNPLTPRLVKLPALVIDWVFDTSEMALP